MQERLGSDAIIDTCHRAADLLQAHPDPEIGWAVLQEDRSDVPFFQPQVALEHSGHLAAAPVNLPVRIHFLSKKNQGFLRVPLGFGQEDLQEGEGRVPLERPAAFVSHAQVGEDVPEIWPKIGKEEMPKEGQED